MSIAADAAWFFPKLRRSGMFLRRFLERKAGKSADHFVAVIGKVAANAWNSFSSEPAQQGEVLAISTRNMHESDSLDWAISQVRKDFFWSEMRKFTYEQIQSLCY
jgi:hypothetical protein